MAGLRTLSDAVGSRSSEKRSQCALVELSKLDDKPTGRKFVLQYFPESITSSKGVEYSPKPVPGGSLPLYQWTQGSEHTVSFTACFSSDVDLLALSGTDAKVNGKSIMERLKTVGQSSRNVDLRAVVAWLRSYTLPSYGALGQTGSPITKAPNKLLLVLPNSGIGMAGGGFGAGSADSMYCLMTSCEVTYQAFFPSGLPRYLEVSLGFSQTAQIGGRILFPSNDLRMYSAAGDGGDFLGYPVEGSQPTGTNKGDMGDYQTSYVPDGGGLA